MSSSSDWLIFEEINQKEIIDITAAMISDVLEAGLHNQLWAHPLQSAFDNFA